MKALTRITVIAVAVLLVAGTVSSANAGSSPGGGKVSYDCALCDFSTGSPRCNSGLPWGHFDCFEVVIGCEYSYEDCPGSHDVNADGSVVRDFGLSESNVATAGCSGFLIGRRYTVESAQEVRTLTQHLVM